MLKCEKCGATANNHGEPFVSPRALRMHQLHCQGKQVTQKRDNTLLCDCQDGGEWRLLNKTHPQEMQAYQLGYKKICDKCEEII